MICLQCDSHIDEFYVNAPAVVETLAMCGAEVTLEELRHDLKHDMTGQAFLPTFRLDDVLETIDPRYGHQTLEVGDEDTEFHCPACDATISTESVWAAVEQREVEA